MPYFLRRSERPSCGVVPVSEGPEVARSRQAGCSVALRMWKKSEWSRCAAKHKALTVFAFVLFADFVLILL